VRRVTRAARQTVVWSALLALVLGSSLPAPRHLEGAAFDDVPAMGVLGAACGLDDVALSGGSGRVLVRAKGPTRSPGGVTLRGHAIVSTPRTSCAVARIALARPDRIPLYDLHRVYRI
jgi:hypothetical protein